MAAHLHDSVLQTLAMVQRRADDPREVAALARRQERELRAWLSARPESARGESRLASALQDAAEEVEAAHGVEVDVVAVGDRELDDKAEALVAAAREAMTNAAKFGGGSPVAVYAEVSDDGALRCSCATAVPASTPPPCRRIAAACASRSSGGWSATAAARA